MPAQPLPVPEVIDVGALCELCELVPRMIAALAPRDLHACLLRRPPAEGDVLFFRTLPGDPRRVVQAIDLRAVGRHVEQLVRGQVPPGFEDTMPAGFDDTQPADGG